MKLTEVIDDALLIAALINNLIRKNIDVLVVIFDDYLNAYVDAYILEANAVDDNSDHLDLIVSIDDHRMTTGYRRDTLEVLASDYILERDPHKLGAWRLTKVYNETR